MAPLGSCRAWAGRRAVAGTPVDVIGSLEKTVIDCPDPRALAEFYCQVLGMRINEDIGVSNADGGDV